ncbi:MAG: hypothetical protein JF922_13730 [Candidatus Dormibacteraeota bacterium]|uniref:Uncharacterized protein n=1 Tax=Candidatus Nephthysia bennettiae TaxID=3127016 RepID=A0A934KB58_9BACT|nr:hypothetical protein [Candidatus Dormibacteraeota bacterium]
MSPSVPSPYGPLGPPKLGRRGRLRLAAGAGLLTALLAIVAWVSLAGGRTSGPVYDNAGSGVARTWTWDGTDFTAQPSTGSGPFSSASDMAFDRRNGVVVLWDHGCSKLVMGFTGGCRSQVDRTWTWDGRVWTPQHSDASPRAVGQGVMLYDARLRQVVYVNRVAQAWGWSGSAWRALPLGAAPRLAQPGSVADPGLLLVAMGYDERRSQLVLALPDTTWTWDGSRWKQSAGGIDPADSQSDAHAVYDAARGELEYLGARSIWTWDGVRWSSQPKPSLVGGALGYDPIRKNVIVVKDDASACDKTSCATRVWSWDGTTWSEPLVNHKPALPLTRSGGFNLPMAFDESRGVMVLFATAT